MKKLLLIIILFGLQGYGQKTLEIYNFTAYTVVIADITTYAPGTTTEFSADFGPIGPIALAPGASYTLQNTLSLTRFPFLSPSSSPTIDNWYRRTSPTNVTLMTSPAAWVLGNNQVFNRLSFRILDPNGSFGTVGVASPAISGPGWDAIYDMSMSPPSAITYTVVIF